MLLLKFVLIKNNYPIMYIYKGPIIVGNVDLTGICFG